MIVTPLPGRPIGASRDALLSHGWEGVLEAETAGGLEACAFHLTALSPDQLEALLQVAPRFGLELLTGDDWALLAGGRSRFSAMARSWTLPESLRPLAAPIGLGLPADAPTLWRVAGGPLQVGDEPLFLPESARPRFMDCRLDQDDLASVAPHAEAHDLGLVLTQIQTHSAMEPHGIVAEVNPDGTATVWASTQATGSIAGGLAGALGVPAGRIRVITEHMGGGFGAKFGVQAWDVLTATFAKETGRPVKGLLPRRLEHLVGGNRPDSIQRLALAGTKDGTFTALVGDVRGTPGNGTGGADTSVPRVYRIPKVKMSQRGVSTFTERGAAFRAPGHPPGLFAASGRSAWKTARCGARPTPTPSRARPSKGRRPRSAPQRSAASSSTSTGRRRLPRRTRPVAPGR